MNTLKREQIKDKMIRLAAEHWNVQENEIDANFDPLIILLFDAVAAEMETVGYQIRDIQNTLLDELSALMLPQALLRAKPASCILSALPSEEIGILKKHNNFSTIAQTQKTGELVKETELNFTPIGEVKLLKVNTGYIKIGSKVFKYQPDGKRILVHEEPTGKRMVTEIYFTLHSSSLPVSLDGLQLFFDLRGHSEANNFYFTLQNSELLINNSITKFSKGYYKNEQYQISIKDAFNKDGDYSRKIQKEIAALYANQFITIGSEAIGAPTQTHQMLNELPEKLVQEITSTPASYCTLQLSRPFDQEILERLQIGVNAFPVINRRLEKTHFKTDKWVNIIPLQVNGSYLDIQSIEGLGGTQYKIQMSNDDGKVNEGEAIVRSARVGKSSSHDVRNTIKSLLEAIRDESAYFSRISNDFIATRLNEISKILTRLEDQVQLSKDEKPTFRYVLLRAKTAGETVQVNYWTTDPVEAGYVKASAIFKPVQHTITSINNNYALTSAIGGIENLNDYSQKQMLVRQLSSKGKIISIEDVKLLCYELLGSKLKSVDVQKTSQILPGNNSGIARVININIEVNKNDFSENELIYFEKQLRYQLDVNAGFIFPFEINIKTD